MTSIKDAEEINVGSITSFAKSLADIKKEEELIEDDDEWIDQSAIIEDLVDPCNVVMVTGQEKEALKTWLVLDLVLARVSGGKWLSMGVRQAKRALIISPEMGRRKLFGRLRQLAAGRRMDIDAYEHFIRIVDEPITFLPADVEGPSRQQLINLMQIPKGEMGLIVIDTLRQCFVGDENSSLDAARFMQAIRALARKIHCPIVIVHHSSRGGTGNRAARGSVELTAAPDVLITLNTAKTPRTMHFKCRGYADRDPLPYELEATADQIAVVVAGSLASRPTTLDNVADVKALLLAATSPMTVTKLREALAVHRGAKPGSKYKLDIVQRALSDLVAQGDVIKTTSGAYQAKKTLT